MPLRYYQEDAIANVEKALSRVRSTLVQLPTGCHEPDQLVLKHDGSLVRACDVKKGDLLMGPDSQPREVVRLVNGVAPMVRVRPVKGRPFIVTADHLLSFARTNRSAAEAMQSVLVGQLFEVPAGRWFDFNRFQKHRAKLVRAPGVEFDAHRARLPIEPYFLGVLLGDGGLAGPSVDVTTMDPEIFEELERQAAKWGIYVRAAGKSQSRATRWGLRTYARGRGATNPLTMALRSIGLHPIQCRDRFIPPAYLNAPLSDRLDMLAGLIDTDGHSTCGGFEYVSLSPHLASGVVFLARSVGLASYQSLKVIEAGTYHRVSISGDCAIVPCRLPRKQHGERRQKKDHRRTGFTVEPLDGDREYFGWTVEGADHRYLLDDFTITHNCGKTVVFNDLASRYAQTMRRTLILAHREELIFQAAASLDRAAGISAAIEKAERAEAHEIVPSLLEAGAPGVGPDGKPLVVVGSVQSMVRRLKKFKPDHFDLVVVDECFPAGTPVYTMRFVDQPIETICVGDDVMAWDHTRGRKTYQRVVRVFRRKPSTRLTRIVLSDWSHEWMISCTPEHPFWAVPPDRTDAESWDYVPASQLRRDFTLRTQDDRLAWVVDVISEADEATEVFNLEVEEHHNYFAGGVLVHNCHHAPAKTYRDILEHFSGAKVLGVSATPQRSDDVALGSVFDEVSYQMEIVDAIEDGWLVPIHQQVVQTQHLDLSKVRITAGDLNQGDLETAMTQTDLLHEIAGPAVELSGDRQGIVFAVTVEHAYLLAEAMREQIIDRWRTLGRGAPPSNIVVALDGTSKAEERRDALESYRRGEVQFLVNVSLYTEGTDLPTVGVVVMAAPTKSRGRYTQMIGRGTRPLPGIVDAHPGREDAALRRSAIALSEKTHCLVIDFTENSGKHKLISAADLLAGKYSEPELAMAKSMLARHEVKDILEALRRARAKIKEMEEMRAQARKGYAATTIDPFDPLDILDGSKQGGGGPTVTEKQRRVLKEYGVENVESLDAVQAAGLLKTVAERKAAGLADFNQVRVLMRRGGIRADRAVGLTSLDAAGYIAKLAKNGWRRPPSWDIKFGAPESTK